MSRRFQKWVRSVGLSLALTSVPLSGGAASDMRHSPGAAQPTAAGAGRWVQRAPMTATVHGHKFTRLEVRGAGCQAVYSLSFEAPKAAYSTGNKSANYYRFKAQIQLSDGAVITSRLFFNRKPGKRKYTAASDTSADGCWSKKPHSLRRVNVNGCRGERCAVQDFD